ncbi:MAG: hypothetical protein AB8C84_02665 [Oligoflexales bacterium]
MSENATEPAETDEEAAETIESTTTEDTQESPSGQPKPLIEDKFYVTTFVADEDFCSKSTEKGLEEHRSEYSEQIHKRLLRKESLSLKAVAEHIHKSYYLDWNFDARELMRLVVRRQLVERGVEKARTSKVESLMRVDPTASSRKRRN